MSGKRNFIERLIEKKERFETRTYNGLVQKTAYLIALNLGLSAFYITFVFDHFYPIETLYLLPLIGFTSSLFFLIKAGMIQTFKNTPGRSLIEKAISNTKADIWREAMEARLDSLHKNRLILVEISKNIKTAIYFLLAGLFVLAILLFFIFPFCL